MSARAPLSDDRVRVSSSVARRAALDTAHQVSPERGDRTEVSARNRVCVWPCRLPLLDCVLPRQIVEEDSDGS